MIKSTQNLNHIVENINYQFQKDIRENFHKNNQNKLCINCLLYILQYQRRVPDIQEYPRVYMTSDSKKDF